MNKIKMTVIGMVFMMMLIIFTFDAPVFADEEEKTALLYVTGYEVDNQTIIPGKEFTLKLKVENYSEYVSARDIVVMIDNPQGIVPEYGTLSVEYIDNIGPKSSAEIKFKYKADLELDVSELDFGVYISWDSNETTTPLRISVGREGDFSVDEFTIPENMVIGKKEYIGALIENVSGKDMDNVAMVIKCDDEILASQSIGTMLSGTAKTQYLTVLFEEENKGEHSYELLLTYTDGVDTNKEYIISSGIVNVGDKADTSEAQGNNIDNKDSSAGEENEENQTGISNMVIVCTIGILLIAICCVVLLLIYRRK